MPRHRVARGRRLRGVGAEARRARRVPHAQQRGRRGQRGLERVEAAPFDGAVRLPRKQCQNTVREGAAAEGRQGRTWVRDVGVARSGDGGLLCGSPAMPPGALQVGYHVAEEADGRAAGPALLWQRDWACLVFTEPGPALSPLWCRSASSTACTRAKPPRVSEGTRMETPSRYPRARRPGVGEVRPAAPPGPGRTRTE